MNRVLFAVIIFAAGAFAQESAAGLASLTGRITDASGQPIRKAGLTLRASPDSVYTAASNADGTFSFDGIKPGGYTLSVERAGYLPKMYRTSLHETFSTIALTAGQRLTGIELKLARAATISGTVLDADGDPVANVPVRLLRRTYQNGGGGGGGLSPRVERTVSTDESGKYSIPNLAPGPRYLSAGAGSGSVLSILGMRVANAQASEYYGNTWFPSGKDESEAQAIQILHDDVQGLDIHLLRTRAFLVSGKVVGTIPGHPTEQCQIVLTPVDRPSTTMNMTIEGTHGRIAKDGSFDFPGSHFPAGEYFLVASTMHAGRPALCASRRLTIGNRDIDDAVLNFQPFVELHGSVALEGEQQTDFYALPGNPPASVTMQVSLSPVNVTGLSDIRTKINYDGSFTTFAEIAPGVYDVRVFGMPDRAWVKSVRLGSTQAVDGRIEVTEAASATPLRITLSRSLGQIEGMVETDAGRPVGSSTLILVREPPGLGSISMMSGTQENGRFTLPYVQPGTYRLYAWEDLEEAQRYDPELMKKWEGNSVVVTVKENGSEQVTLRQIPSSDSQ